MNTESQQAKGASAPFRINFIGSISQDNSEILDNIEKNAEKYPVIELTAPHKRPLAIVGGGPSVADKLDILRKWPGDIWSINRTPQYLAQYGIKSTLISVDASTNWDEWSAPEYVEDAIMSSWCPPSIMDAYKNVRIFHMEPFVKGGIHGGSTTAVSMPIPAAVLGYSDVTFFGCESSFLDKDHAYVHESKPDQLIVRANGQDYRTTPPFFVQSQELSKIIRGVPFIYKEDSGGLLRAMIQDEDWSIVAVSESLKAHLEEVNGDQGLYDTKYTWNTCQ